MLSRIRGCFNRMCGPGNGVGSDAAITQRTPLPKGILAVLYSLLLFNAMTMTMVFSYLPKLVKSFGTSEVDTGYYAGLIASALFVGRLIFSFVWGYIADQKGKKFAAIASATGLTFSTLAFGFSYNFAWALLTRLLQGCFMGLIVACKSILSDRCDDTNIALGMSIIISSFSAGLIIGPSCAGFLVFPGEQYPSIFSKDNIFSKYGILLPNFIIFVGFIITTIIGIKLLPKDQKRRKSKDGEQSYLLNPQTNEPSYTEENTMSFKRKNPETYLTVSIKQNVDCNYNESSMNYYQIIEPVVNAPTSSNSNTTLKEKWTNSKAKELFTNKWCVVSCVLYGTYSLVAIGFDELVPLFLATSKRYRGLNFTPADIGLALLIVAIILIILQVTLLASLTTKYGSKRVLIICLLTMAFSFPFLPSISVIQNEVWMWFILCLYLLVCRLCLAGAFLAINILVNNSVGPSLLGSANGLAMSLSSGGRMIAPTLVGSSYSWSLSNIKGIEGNESSLGFPFNQYFPFFILSLGAILNCIGVSVLPRGLDERCQTDDDDTIDATDSQPSNVTNITVSYFTPSDESLL